jgi:hypothetical protein
MNDTIIKQATQRFQFYTILRRLLLWLRVWGLLVFTIVMGFTCYSGCNDQWRPVAWSVFTALELSTRVFAAAAILVFIIIYGRVVELIERFEEWVKKRSEEESSLHHFCALQRQWKD